MKDLDGFKKFAFKLFIPFCFDIFTIQPDFFAQSIVTVLYSFFIGFFCSFCAWNRF